MSEATKKAMPFATSKSKLIEMYGDQMSDNYIRTEINTIIVANRNLSHDKRPAVQKILHRELKEFVGTYGLPKGYNDPNNYYTDN